jgi:hypothetical protein
VGAVRKQLLELGTANVEAFERGELLLRFVFLLQPGIDDVGTVGQLLPSARMDNLLLRRLVHGQQPAQGDERLLALLRGTARDLLEQVLDLLVLPDKERNHVPSPDDFF